MTTLYRLLTDEDTSAFCHKVSAALAAGWELHGDPVMCFDAARGVMTIGNPGAGKSQSVILPVIADTMREADSLIVVDPQGELKHEVMQYARVTGHIVIIHDPTDDTAAP